MNPDRVRPGTSKPMSHSISPSFTPVPGLIAPKAFYFFFFTAVASLQPYLGIYYEQIGLAGRQFGLLLAIPPLTILFAAPLWGMLADQTQQHKRLLQLAIIGVIAAMFLVSRTIHFGLLVPFIFAYAFFFRRSFH